MVVTTIEQEHRAVTGTPARRRLDLHAWVAIAAAALLASGIMTLSAIAYSHVP